VQGEWDAFIRALQTPLPTTFRINGSSQVAKELLERLESDFFSHFANEGETMQLDGAGRPGR